MRIVLTAKDHVYLDAPIYLEENQPLMFKTHQLLPDESGVYDSLCDGLGISYVKEFDRFYE